MATLKDVAELAGGLIHGVNWNELASRDKNSVYDTAYIYDYLIPASDRATAIMRTLDTTVTDRDSAFEAFKQVYRAVIDHSGDDIIAAVKTGKDLLDMESAPSIAKDAYRYIIQATYITAMYGLSLHLPPLDWQQRGLRPIGTIHMSGMSDADIAQHANLVYSMFDGLALIESMGGLKPIKKPVAQSGLGIAPIVVGIIAGAVVLVAVGVAVVIAWFLLAMRDTSTKNQLVTQMCDRAQQSGDAAATAQCIDVLSDPDKQIATAPFRSAAAIASFGVESIAKYALIGAGVYALIVFAPALVRKFKETKAAAA